MSERNPASAASYLPQAIVATAFVAVVPVVAVWELRAHGTVSSPVVCVVIAVALALAASLIGSGYWKRRRRLSDVMFSELLLWEWLRRVRMERRLAGAAELLGLNAEPPGRPASADAERSVVDAFLSRYSGTRGLAIWSVLAILPQNAFAWGGSGGRPVGATRQGGAIGALAALAAVVAVAVAPAHSARTVAPPAAARPAARVTVVKHPAPKAAPRASAHDASSTCQAYNPQLCTVLGDSSGAGGASRSSGPGGGPGAANGSGGTLPFTG